jgi:hypothetical protein
MNTVHVVEGGRHPAVLDVPTGDLSVQALRAGEIKALAGDSDVQ